MIVVIIAGGSGSRLWPLSTPSFPKHLLKVAGSANTLLQNTYNRAKRLSDSIYVVTEASHVEHVRAQLPELAADAFIVEPARRGTASCIVAALEYVSSRHDADESIACIAADHYIRDVTGFVHSFKLADKTASHQKRIVLVGVEPDYPATGFGYIEKGELLSEVGFVFNVQSFKEKPNLDTAQSYLRNGNYLWNCGYFVGSINTFKQAMQAYNPSLLADYERLAAAAPADYEAVYLAFENISIDYALIEKVQDLLVVPAAFDWMDLGSFGDLAKVALSDAKGNTTHGGPIEVEAVQNSYIENHETKPVVVIGLDNCVVINTPHGLLVARKDLAQKVGDVSKRFTN